MTPDDDEVIVVHVNQHKIKEDTKCGTHQPVFTVKRYLNGNLATVRQNLYAAKVEFTGVTQLVYPEGGQLACGARAWLETTAPVKVWIGEGR